MYTMLRPISCLAFPMCHISLVLLIVRWVNGTTQQLHEPQLRCQVHPAPFVLLRLQLVVAEHSSQIKSEVLHCLCSNAGRSDVMRMTSDIWPNASQAGVERIK